MRNERFSISAGAIILTALVYYIAETDRLLAVLVPAAVHELGHIIALRALGLRICSFRIELKGFCMEYRGYTGAAGHMLAAVAGPAAGLVYALAASIGAARLGSPWLELSAGVSLLLSCFNMLPALPLDGGRVLGNLSALMLGERQTALLLYCSGLLTGALLLAAGVWLMLRGKGIAMVLAAVWLLMYQNCAEGIVNPREIL